MKVASPFARLSTPDLERLLEALEVGDVDCPLSGAQLQAANLGRLGPLLGELGGLDGEGLALVLRAVLAEREERGARSVDLVWTGPEGAGSTARDTAVVVRRLFSRARRRVVVAGYVFTFGTEILRPLHAAMERGVEVLVFLHIPPLPTGGHRDEHLRRSVEENFLTWWNFGPPQPRIFYDPRTLVAGRRKVSLHAKCVVVDEEEAFVSSANFTSAAHERNLEVGVLVRDRGFAEDLATQWLRLVSEGTVKEVDPEPMQAGL